MGMRKSKLGVGILKAGPNAEPQGIGLGFDFCSEHENGISGLTDVFGVGSRSNVGIERLQVALPPHADQRAKSFSLGLLDDGMDLVLIGGDVSVTAEDAEELTWHTDHVRRTGSHPKLLSSVLAHRRRWLIRPGNPGEEGLDGLPTRTLPKTKEEKEELVAQTAGITTYWDNKAFAIVARGEVARHHVSGLFDAFRRMDVVITNGSSLSASLPGLNLMVASRIPEQERQKAFEDDHARKREAKTAAGRTGLISALTGWMRR